MQLDEQSVIDAPYVTVVSLRCSMEWKRMDNRDQGERLVSVTAQTATLEQTRNTRLSIQFHSLTEIHQWPAVQANPPQIA
jgi:hypothetical protein